VRRDNALNDQQRALEQFLRLPPLEPCELAGLWQGRGVPTGHPFDGVLENLGWFGKRFNPDLRADALLFHVGGRKLRAIDPKWVPLPLALRFHAFGRTALAAVLFAGLQRCLQAKGPVASIKTVAFEGVASAAMIYDDQPIVDHFRRINDDSLMGLMAMRDDDRFYVFELERVIDPIALAQNLPVG
jgi:hypothetical protein